MKNNKIAKLEESHGWQTKDKEKGTYVRDFQCKWDDGWEGKEISDDFHHERHEADPGDFLSSKKEA